MNHNLSRRHFIKSSSCLLIPSFSQGREKKAALAMGFGTYGLPGYSVPEAIRLVSKTGFDSIELAAMPGYHGSPEKLTKPVRIEVRKLIEESGIKLGALMGFPRPDPSKMRENKDRMEKLLELNLDLSGKKEPPLIQSVLGGGRWDEKKTVFRDCLGPLVELASKAGTQLSIKPHRGHAMSRPEQAVWLIEQLNAKGKLSLTFDYSHFAFREMAVEKTVAIALPHTGYVVVKDAVRQQNGGIDFLLPGTAGGFPHAQVLKAFSQGGYHGEVCCEISSMVWRKKGYDPQAATKTCFRNMKRMFAEAEIERKP